MKISSLSFDGKNLRLNAALDEDLTQRLHGAIRVRMEHGDKIGPNELIATVSIDFYESSSVYPKRLVSKNPEG